MNNLAFKASLLPLYVCLVFLYSPHALAKEFSHSEQGSVVSKSTPHGAYLQYVPKRLSNDFNIVVLVHGSIKETEDPLNAARLHLQRWTTTADKQNCILLAPAFNQENFGGHKGPGGGYRGLFGREVGADEFINEIVSLYQSDTNQQFYLYGHSAGGQLVSRYLIMHPEKIKGAVISAAATFAFPDPNEKWTNGMLPLKRTMRWSKNGQEQKIDIRPIPDNWLKASQLPVTVIVGKKDTATIKNIPGQKGSNHVERARHWVDDMNTLAFRHNKQGTIKLITVKNAGHSSRQLTPASIKALLGTYVSK